MALSGNGAFYSFVIFILLEWRPAWRFGQYFNVTTSDKTYNIYVNNYIEKMQSPIY